MMRVLTAAVLAFCMGVCLAGEAAGAAAPKGQQVPHQIIPIEDFAVAVKNWEDESLPHYSIMNHVGEWDNAFQPTQVMGGQKPTKPDAKLFEKAQLIAISRVSDAPAPGQKVLVIKSFVLENGEMVLTYSFIPPTNKAGYKVKNTLLVAIPTQYQNYGLRFIEDTETAGSMAARAEYEEALREGRIKPGTNLQQR